MAHGKLPHYLRSPGPGTVEAKMSALTQKDRTVLGRMVVNLLDDWGVGASDQVNILALPDGTPTRMLRRYHEDTPLPDNPDVMKRVEHLMGIADALRTTFPRNANIGLLWMQQPCKRLRRRRPIEIIVEDGLSGLITVRTHLDCAFAWRESERND
jgi:uncharacterized protein (DUF2384 family)